MKLNSIKWAFFAFTFTFVSCTKETQNDEPTPATSSTSTVKVKLDHVWGGTTGDEVKLNTSTPYINAQGDSVTFTTFNYYISNIRLVRTDESEFVPQKSYYLIKLSNASGKLELEIPNVPFAEYKAIHYMIGVDSARVVDADLSLPALQPINGMFWSWNSGYIFVKCEGNSPQAASSNKKFAFHVGGYRQPNSAIQMVSHDFGTGRLRVVNGAVPEIHVYVDMKKFFTGPGTTLQMSNFTAPNHAPGAFNMNIAKNYREMFMFDHIHN